MSSSAAKYFPPASPASGVSSRTTRTSSEISPGRVGTTLGKSASTGCTTPTKCRSSRPPTRGSRPGPETRTSPATGGRDGYRLRRGRPLGHPPDDTDLAYVTIRLTEGNGVLHTAGDREVHVAVAGHAVLQALGSGRPDNELPFGDAHHLTFQGRALALVRPTGAGTVTVSAESPKVEDSPA
ncbi:hypothetical protein [Cryptosporangium arvum]|uniref:hypothetical protein n=1 Tax=Cryptosporangium arvum TaxID=80871 RepID=UPI003CCC126A